jgi:iron complex transport system permease protein
VTARPLIVTGLAAAALAAALAASVAVGSVTLPLTEVVAALTGSRDADGHLIVADLRVPRTLAGLVAGLCLAIAGVLFQGVTRNPLASPALLGVTAGGSFAVVVGVAVLGLPPAVGVWLAFLGGGGAAGLALALAGSGRDGFSPVRLVLSGAIVSALLTAWTTALLAMNERRLDEVRHWLAGSLAGRDSAALAPLLPLVAAGVLTAWLLARPLDALALGDEAAAGLGQRPARLRLYGGVAGVLLSAAAVALAGPIAFIGLAVPHMARSLSGTSAHRWVLTVSVLLGPAMLLGADVVGRVVARPGEVQAGVLTALLGAPVLIRLTVLQRREPA